MTSVCVLGQIHRPSQIIQTQLQKAHLVSKRMKERDIAIDTAVVMSQYMQSHFGNKLYQPIGSLKKANGIHNDLSLDTLETLTDTHYPKHT